MKKRRKNSRYYTENMTPKELKDYYESMLRFWTLAGDKSSITYYTNKLKEEA
ncbi:unnamed protein product [marine sediment metagenome]|uniref:Uncharacterized protein n=1 Tax=marine sediment metagenome TaxID=412755 RepID=X1HFN4_9ZZZZ